MPLSGFFGSRSLVVGRVGICIFVAQEIVRPTLQNQVVASRAQLVEFLDGHVDLCVPEGGVVDLLRKLVRSAINSRLLKSRHASYSTIWVSLFESGAVARAAFASILILLPFSQHTIPMTPANNVQAAAEDEPLVIWEALSGCRWNTGCTPDTRITCTRLCV